MVRRKKKYVRSYYFCKAATCIFIKCDFDFETDSEIKKIKSISIIHYYTS